VSANKARADLVSEFSEYSKYGRRFEKAIDTALASSVKRHLFLPSRREAYTVVGHRGDEFLDPASPYCSCDDFYFRVMAGKRDLCYHLISYQIASKAELLDTVEFDDHEFNQIMGAIAEDVLTSDRTDRVSG
jgi:predicted nucleic acid-binding Zn finger protein